MFKFWIFFAVFLSRYAALVVSVWEQYPNTPSSKVPGKHYPQGSKNLGFKKKFCRHLPV